MSTRRDPFFVLIAVIAGAIVIFAAKPDITTAATPFVAALIAVALFFGSARLRRA